MELGEEKEITLARDAKDSPEHASEARKDWDRLTGACDILIGEGTNVVASKTCSIDNLAYCTLCSGNTRWPVQWMFLP